MAKPPPGAAHAPPKYTRSVVGAMKALAHGIAEPHQQKIALDWIINEACKTYDLSYRPDSDRETVLAEGRRFVGLNIVKMCNIDTTNLKD